MIYIFPDYYEEFSCTADRCEDTCCAGWQIMIDDRSLAKYKKAVFTDKFRGKLLRSIDWREQSFRQDEQKRCAFLNEKNLCDMYTAMGKNSLCKTCKNYPRHIEEFENVRDITLSLSCPEVAKILLNKREPVRFVEKYREMKDEVYDDFDPFLYDILDMGRQTLIRILQERTASIQKRCERAVGLATKMQDAVDAGNMFSCQDLFDVYDNGQETQKHYRLKDMFGFSKRIFSEVYRLERLRDDWEMCLVESAYWLHGKDEEFYESLHEDFSAWLIVNMPEWETISEQILVYFISTYFCGAVYDDRITAKVWMAIISLFVLYELWMSRWVKNGRDLTMEEVIEVTYRYSRELEHSDQNLEQMETFLCKFFTCKF